MQEQILFWTPSPEYLTVHELLNWLVAWKKNLQVLEIIATDPEKRVSMHPLLAAMELFKYLKLLTYLSGLLDWV